MTSIAASLLLVGCVDYTIQDPDDVLPLPSVIEERFVQAPLPMLDVLFVVDGTGSMAEEQESFADAADAFVAVLDDLAIAYQLGVTSMDAAADGALLGRPWIITAATEDPARALADALEIGADSTAATAGLYAATRTLADAQGLNRGFRRADAGLHVVFVSDGDDESEAWLGQDPGAAFGAVLTEVAVASGHSARASAVVGDVPGGCTGATGTAQPGTRYAAVAAAAGGVVGSICAADFGALAAALGDAGVEWPTTFPLSDVPVDGTMRVEVDGERLAEGWRVDAAAPALVFDTPPAPDAVIAVVYTAAVPG